MYSNSFTPAFGGKPDFFFGRGDILAKFDRALVDRGSDERAMFITATRGMGKTALLEQISLRASKQGWRTIDLGPEQAVAKLVRELSGADEETEAVSPQPGINILGAGASFGGISVARTRQFDAASLDSLLLAACEKERKGVMVTLDEAQKVTEAEVSALCGAFQMASRKGHNVMLALAGLPYSYEKVIHYQGCTFMRRASHEQLTLLRREEVSQAFAEGLAASGGLSLEEGPLNQAIAASYGHPYLVQLLGYYLVTLANEQGAKGPLQLGEDAVARARRFARGTYEERALRPMLSEFTAEERRYLAAMSTVLDDHRVARVSDIADALHKTVKQLSGARDALLKYGAIVSPARGQLMFAVPLLAAYMASCDERGSDVSLLRDWGV